MRISDWSSDVCSSDLGSFLLGCGGALANLILDAVDERVRGFHDFLSAKGRGNPRRDDAHRCGGADHLRGVRASPWLKTSFYSSLDRRRVVSGKSVSVRVELGGRRIIKKKK